MNEKMVRCECCFGCYKCLLLYGTPHPRDLSLKQFVERGKSGGQTGKKFVVIIQKTLTRLELGHTRRCRHIFSALTFSGIGYRPWQEIYDDPDIRLLEA